MILRNKKMNLIRLTLINFTEDHDPRELGLWVSLNLRMEDEYP